MYKGSTSGLYPELSQALSPEGQLSRRRHGARRVGGALQLPHSGFPNPRIFHAALLLGLDRICLQATLVSVSQLELGRAPRQQSCSSARSARRCSSELRFQKARSLCPRGLCARDCVSCWGLALFSGLPSSCSRTCFLSSQGPKPHGLLGCKHLF